MIKEATKPSLISQRTQNLGTEHAFLVLAEVNRLVAQGKDILSFSIGQPDFRTPKNICDAAKDAIEDGQHGYTPSAGIGSLREAVVNYFKRTRNLHYHMDDIVVSSGAKPFIMYAIMSTTDAGVGHEVIYPSPGFPIYESQITACGAIPKALYLREEHDFGFGAKDLEDQLTPNTRLLILNSPHNPTGRTLSAVEMEGIAEVLQAYPQCWVLADEVYSQMVHDVPFASIAQVKGMQERTILLDGLSKSYAMTGWRMGFMANAQMASYFSTWVTNTESCANALTQWAGIEALNGDQAACQEMMSSFTRRRDLMLHGLNQLPGISTKKAGGAFYLWPNVSELCRMVEVKNAEALRVRWLHEAGVAVLADVQFGQPLAEEGDHIRFSYAAKDDVILAGIKRLAAWIDKAKQ